MAFEPTKIKLKTIQHAQWRLLQRDEFFFDVTVKSGDVMYAPTWAMLNDYRSGVIDEDDYRHSYKELMATRIQSNPQYFKDTLLLRTVGHDSLVMACYCKAGKFCHRRILVDEVLPEHQDIIGLQFEFLGEIVPESKV